MGMAEALAWSWLFPNNSLSSKAVGPTDSADLWDRGKTHRPCAAGDHCDARDAGKSKAPTNLEAQKALTQAQGQHYWQAAKGGKCQLSKTKQNKQTTKQTNKETTQRQLR